LALKSTGQLAMNGRIDTFGSLTLSSNSNEEERKDNIIGDIGSNYNAYEKQKNH
jgi:hypothetical protein